MQPEFEHKLICHFGHKRVQMFCFPFSTKIQSYAPSIFIALNNVYLKLISQNQIKAKYQFLLICKSVQLIYFPERRYTARIDSSFVSEYNHFNLRCALAHKIIESLMMCLQT